MDIFAAVPPRLRHPLRQHWRWMRGVYLRGGRFALNDLDRKLEKHLDFDGGFYVELGANDGQTQSNTYYFERRRDWRGVLIEPLPHRFLECRRLRGRNNAVHCAACVGFGHPERFVEMHYADLMSVAALPGVDTDARLTRAAPHFDEGEAYRFAAPARTLTAILEESAAPAAIDLLSLDVEGAELAVLSGIDHARFSFRCMLIETADPPAVEAALAPYGYGLIERLSVHDYLFGR